MITHKRLTSTESIYFSQVWDLYKTSFPENERRNINGQVHTLGLNNYYCQIVFKDDQFVGILFWWNFETLRYIEHIAIRPDRQNEGLGSEIMKDFLSLADSKPILLEVEPATTDIQKKRLRFYDKLGFKMNAYDYIQPAIQKSTNPVALKVLSFPSQLNIENYNAYITTYHSQVFSHMEI